MLAPGAILEHYRVGAVLGQGGMGVVYEGQDIRLQRPVAIKILPSSGAVDDDRRERFAQEARAASALNHPNIITIHDVGSSDGVDFMVMEYVRGTTLEQRLRPDGIPLADLTRYGVQMADALAQAHGAGIVHRDLKPSNVMVTDDGRIKILDFGIAKLLEPAEFRVSDDRTTRAQTEAGRILGTAAYMSPEQAEGRPVDGRSDIFSFGSILYELATGRRPFGGDSRLKVLTGIVNADPPPPKALRASLPADLEKVILRCLRKDPARRYQTMADLKVALEDIGAETAGAALASGRLRSRALRRIGVGAAVLAALVIGGFAATRWFRADLSDPLRAVAVTTFTGQERYPSFSPDGGHLAFSWNGPKQDNFDVYVQLIGAGTPLRLTTDPSPDHNTAWSPDGRWIAFLRGDPQSGRSEVRLVPALGGPERKLTEIDAVEVLGSPRLLAWCPDSRCLVFTDRPEQGGPDAVFVYAIDTAGRRQVTRPAPPAQGDSQPSISPDGRWLVFRRNISNGFTGELYVQSLTRALEPDGPPRRLTLAALDANHPAWLPGSDAVVFSARGRLWRQSVAGASAADPLPFVGEDGVMPAISRSSEDGLARLAYVRSFADTNVWRIDTAQAGGPVRSGPVAAISSTRTDGNPQLSPDGTRVALTSNRSGDPEIWLTDLDGGNAVQLTAMGASATGTARWSPDGAQVTFNSNVEGHWDVYVIGVAGGTPRRLTDHPGNDSASSFSTDGRWVYFNSNRTGEFQIWKVPVSGGTPVQVTHNGGYIALESPDGAYVYYTQTIAAPSPLWRVSTAGGPPEKIADGVVWRCFAVLDGGVYYIGRIADDTRLQYLDFRSGAVTTVASALGEVSVGMAASADGRTILYTRVDSTINDLMLVDRFR
jgi:Tol biopolymer transport system component/predicted Ser/Thr protein kinase